MQDTLKLENFMLLHAQNDLLKFILDTFGPSISLEKSCYTFMTLLSLIITYTVCKCVYPL